MMWLSGIEMVEPRMGGCMFARIERSGNLSCLGFDCQGAGH